MKPQFFLEDFHRVLLVEGYSDLRFYAELLEHLGKGGQVFIKEFCGRADLASKIAAFLTPQLLSTKTAVAVVADADQNARQAEEMLAGALSRATRQDIIAGGWTSGNPRVGLFVAPGEGQPGEIETLVWQSWSSEPRNGAQRACIEQFSACMASAGAVPRSPAKGLVSALLAIRNDDDPRLGPGAQARVFDFNRPEYDALKHFLTQF